MSDAVRLELRLGERSIPVWAGVGAFEQALAELDPDLAGRRIFAVTSAPVKALHGNVLTAFAEAASEFTVLEVEDGEGAKSVGSARDLWRALIAGGGKRDSLMISLGGGSVGDLVGFVAGTFLRGIDYVQLPTTLLAQVDAAIGGKTAINLPEAKNSVGAFHHPLATIADTEFLSTLTRRQLRCGLFEVVKTAVMRDEGLFRMVESTIEGLLAGEPNRLARVVEVTAAAKISVVEEDPREEGVRKLLNFGHTLGHALESLVMERSGPEVLEHGEAVGYGMVFALDLARKRGFEAEQYRRVVSLVKRIGLPSLPTDLDRNELATRMARDKKSREHGMSWILPRAVGDGYIADDLSPNAVAEALDRFLAVRGDV